MERDPAIDRNDTVDAAEDRTDDLAWIASPSPCPGLPSSGGEIAASVARAREQILGGRGIAGEDVARWAAALGTADERPMPSEWPA